jgi:hypothetical protein
MYTVLVFDLHIYIIGTYFEILVSTVCMIFSCLPEFNFAQYEIVGGNDERLFACDISTGRIYNTGFLIYDEQSVSRLC